MNGDLAGGEDGVGDGKGFDGGADGVDADDVRSAECRSNNRSQGCVIARGGRELDGTRHTRKSRRSHLRRRRVGEFGEADRDAMAKETLAREGSHERKAEGFESCKVGKKGIVFAEILAKTETGIEDDGLAMNPGVQCVREAGAELFADKGDNVWHRRLG